MNIFRNQSALIAALVFCAATLLGAISVRQIVSSISRPSDQLLTIRAGTHYWHLVDQSLRCVGDLNLAFENSATSSRLTGGGSLRLRTTTSPIPISITLEMNFNDLGQLGGSIVRLTSNDMTASIGSMNVAPINVRIRHKFNQQPQQVYDLSIPGPIFVEAVSADVFRLRYRFLDNLNFPSGNNLGLAQLVTWQEVAADQICGDAALDVSTLLTRAQQFTQTLPDLDRLLQDFK